MTPRAVCLDLDETLAVTSRDRATILADATAALDAQPIDRSAYLEAHRSVHPGDTRTPIFRRLLADADGDVDPETLATEYNRRLLDALEPVPGARETIRRLRDRWPVALLTNGPRRAQRSKIAALGWADAFDAVVVTGEVGAPKPDPAAFGAALDALGVAPAETVHVGDQVEADIEGATRAGLAAIQVQYGAGPDPSTVADRVVDRRALESLPDVIEGLENLED